MAAFFIVGAILVLLLVVVICLPAIAAASAEKDRKEAEVEALDPSVRERNQRREFIMLSAFLAAIAVGAILLEVFGK